MKSLVFKAQSTSQAGSGPSATHQTDTPWIHSAGSLTAFTFNVCRYRTIIKVHRENKHQKPLAATVKQLTALGVSYLPPPPQGLQPPLQYLPWDDCVVNSIRLQSADLPQKQKHTVGKTTLLAGKQQQNPFSNDPLKNQGMVALKEVGSFTWKSDRLQNNNKREKSYLKEKCCFVWVFSSPRFCCTKKVCAFHDTFDFNCALSSSHGTFTKKQSIHE